MGSSCKENRLAFHFLIGYPLTLCLGKQKVENQSEMGERCQWARLHPYLKWQDLKMFEFWVGGNTTEDN